MRALVLRRGINQSGHPLHAVVPARRSRSKASLSIGSALQELSIRESCPSSKFPCSLHRKTRESPCWQMTGSFLLLSTGIGPQGALLFPGPARPDPRGCPLSDDLGECQRRETKMALPSREVMHADVLGLTLLMNARRRRRRHAKGLKQRFNGMPHLRRPRRYGVLAETPHSDYGSERALWR